MSTLTKADLANELTDKLGLNNREAREFIDLFFEEIAHNLEEGTPVKLSGFGNFLLRDKSERPGRNPKTGEEKIISARRVVTFSPSQKLKDQVNHKQ
jgi:integration host factor subunit alpha